MSEVVLIRMSRSELYAYLIWGCNWLHKSSRQDYGDSELKYLKAMCSTEWNTIILKQIGEENKIDY